MRYELYVDNIGRMGSYSNLDDLARDVLHYINNEYEIIEVFEVLPGDELDLLFSFEPKAILIELETLQDFVKDRFIKEYIDTAIEQIKQLYDVNISSDTIYEYYVNEKSELLDYLENNGYTDFDDLPESEAQAICEVTGKLAECKLCRLITE